MKKLLSVSTFLCLTCVCFAQNSGWAGFDAEEFITNVKQISNNLKVEQNIKEQIKNNEKLQLKDLQNPWLEEFQRLIKFSIKQDKVEAIKALFNYVETEYNEVSVLNLKQMALEYVIEEAKSIKVKQVYQSINPHAIGYTATNYTLQFNVKFIEKYFNLLMTEQINKENLKKVVFNNRSNISLLNAKEVISLIDSY